MHIYRENEAVWQRVKFIFIFAKTFYVLFNNYSTGNHVTASAAFQCCSDMFMLCVSISVKVLLINEMGDKACLKDNNN